MPIQESTAAQPCLFVIGMHRSGTSAITASLAEMGLAVPSESARIAASAWNERGNFESRALVDLNNRLLFSLGGTWSGPPELKPGWDASHALDDWRDRAGRSFQKTFPSRPMAWKDPRNCLTLPFWRTVIGEPMAAVFVYRDPVEVARSLEAREGVTLTYGLALWDRYVRSACANLVGLPTLVADFGEVLDQPGQWTEEATAFLRSIDVNVVTLADRADPASESGVGSASGASSLAAGLRHQRSSEDQRPDLFESQFEVLAALRAMNGQHHPWTGVDLGTEPPWVDDVLALRRKTDQLRSQLNRAERLAQTSRIFRITRLVGNLRHRS
ncbi:MAG TPA: hypothetical protein VIJ09_06060 [Acidimicrobiales bacterium]